VAARLQQGSFRALFEALLAQLPVAADQADSRELLEATRHVAGARHVWPGLNWRTKGPQRAPGDIAKPRDFGERVAPGRALPTERQPSEVPLARALQHMQSLADCDRGVLEVTACGASAIPALRAIVLAPEPSGLYQPRRAAVEALAALGAEQPLMELLAAPIEATDPVARAGEEAVRNAAARALSASADPGLLPVLLRLAATQLLPGAIEVLGARRCLDAMPSLIAALGDDIARPAAETALRNLGEAAASGLWHAARNPQPDRESESESSLRRRRASLAALADIGSTVTAEELDALCDEADAGIAAAACRIRLTSGTASERQRAAERLVALLDTASLAVRLAIEESLLAHEDVTRALLAASGDAPHPDSHDTMKGTARQQSLRRISRCLAPARAGMNGSIQ